MIRWSKKYLEMQAEAVIVLWKDMGLHSGGHQISEPFTESIDSWEWREQWNARIDEIIRQHERIWHGNGGGYECFKMDTLLADGKSYNECDESLNTTKGGN